VCAVDQGCEDFFTSYFYIPANKSLTGKVKPGSTSSNWFTRIGLTHSRDRCAIYGRRLPTA